MTWTITLEGFLPMSGNKRDRSHWAVKSRELRDVTEMIWAISKHQKIPAATNKRSVRITLHKKKGVRDDDAGNIDARSKAILDAMTKLGLLIDDDGANMEWLGVHEGDRRATKCTVIEIGDCE